MFGSAAEVQPARTFVPGKPMVETTPSPALVSVEEQEYIRAQIEAAIYIRRSVLWMRNSWRGLPDHREQRERESPQTWEEVGGKLPSMKDSTF